MIRRFFYDVFRDKLGFSEEMSTYSVLIISLILFGLLGFVLFRALRFFGRKTVHRIADETTTKFDDMLIKNRVFLNLARVLIFVIILSFLNTILADFPSLLDYGERIVNVIIVIYIIILLGGVLSSIKDFMRTNSAYKDKPLDSYVQIFMVVAWIIGIIISFSILTGKPLKAFLYGLGAFSAVFILIFKDTLLGFIASIQVSINDTVRIGDWITMDKYGADGDVIEINLTSVIIQNFDKTISSIPTYNLISESFKNWRTMNTSGGRRIMRSVLIKMNSIKFLTESDIERFKKIQLISEYVETMSESVRKHNEENNVDNSVLINGRNLTNFGSFRVYLDKYVEQHPDINQDMTMMSRQLDPTPNGIPLQIYAFSRQQEWINYERVMADIFDHILASVKYFDLEAFENPSSADIRKLQRKEKKKFFTK